VITDVETVEADDFSSFYSPIYTSSFWYRMCPPVTAKVAIPGEREIRRYDMLRGGCADVNWDLDSLAH
jgi:hypothetical protein